MLWSMEALETLWVSSHSIEVILLFRTGEAGAEIGLVLSDEPFTGLRA